MSLFGSTKTTQVTQSTPVTADNGGVAISGSENVSFSSGMSDVQLHDFLDTLKRFGEIGLEEVKSSLTAVSSTVQQSNNPAAGTISTVVNTAASSTVDIVKQLALPITLIIGAIIFFKVIK